MLETFEILDRYELLFPKKTKISDLRRSYNDKDLSSIFRIVNDANKENVRKLIMENNTWKLWPLLDQYASTHFTNAFKNFFVNNIIIDKDCFSRGQLQSKVWLIEELKKLNIDLGTLFLCAGWYGTLATMLFESGIKLDKIRSFDVDASCVDIAEVFNKPWFIDNWRFKALTADILDIDYTEYTWQFWSNKNNRMSYPITDIPNTIINTSCEHINDFEKWYSKIPTDKLLVLQTNDYFDVDEHVNCSLSLTDFANKTPMTKVLFEGELELPKYKRFMRIGYR